MVKVLLNFTNVKRTCMDRKSLYYINLLLLSVAKSNQRNNNNTHNYIIFEKKLVLYKTNFLKCVLIYFVDFKLVQMVLPLLSD